MSKTPYSSKVWILGTFWLLHKDDKDLDEGWRYFFQSHELSLPLAYALEKEFFENSEKTQQYIEDCWNNFCDNLGLSSDNFYTSMQQMIDLSKELV